MRDTNEYLKMMLRGYRIRLAKEEKELNDLPEGRLGFRSVDGRTNYVHLYDNAGKLMRKGITKDEHMTSLLARKKYIQTSIGVLSEEIQRLEDFIEQRTEPTAQNILDLLPYSFQQIDESLFFPERKFNEEWACTEFEENTFHMEKKIFITSRGLRVRSKSELIIAEKLDAYGVPYRYDQVIHINGMSASPDFSFMIAMKTLYWEHNGMMTNPEYRASNKYKMEKYEKMGIVPWDNLILTYDKVDGSIDLMEVDAIIRNRLL